MSPSGGGYLDKKKQKRKAGGGSGNRIFMEIINTLAWIVFEIVSKYLPKWLKLRASKLVSSMLCRDIYHETNLHELAANFFSSRILPTHM